MPPYIDHLVVCPGDSIHVELDFSDLGKVQYSGKGAENNEKFNDFLVRYYLRVWPGFSTWELDSKGEPAFRKYEHADVFVTAIRQTRESYLARLDEFIREARPSTELRSAARKSRPIIIPSSFRACSYTGPTRGKMSRITSR